MAVQENLPLGPHIHTQALFLEILSTTLGKRTGERKLIFLDVL